MKRKVRARNVYNVHLLRDAIPQEWDQLLARFLRKIVASLRKRSTELIRVNEVTHSIEKKLFKLKHTQRNHMWIANPQSQFSTQVYECAITNKKDMMFL